jgi:hypothetical protein
MRADLEVSLQPLAPEIEEPIPQANLLVHPVVARDLERNRIGRREHLERASEQLDLAGRERRILGTLWPDSHLALDGDDRLGVQVARGVASRRIVVVEDDLGLSVVIAQAHEDDALVVANSVDPAREARRGACVRGSKLVTGVGSVAVCSHRIGVRCQVSGIKLRGQVRPRGAPDP